VTVAARNPPIHEAERRVKENPPYARNPPIREAERRVKENPPYAPIRGAS
jgi:hypothetical protein